MLQHCSTAPSMFVASAIFSFDSGVLQAMCEGFVDESCARIIRVLFLNSVIDVVRDVTDCIFTIIAVFFVATAKGRAGYTVTVGRTQVSLDAIFVFGAARTFATGVQGFGTNHRTLHTALSTSTFAGSTMRCELVPPFRRTISLCFGVYAELEQFYCVSCRVRLCFRHRVPCCRCSSKCVRVVSKLATIV